MPSSPVGARWTGHPLINVFSGNRTLSAHVKFVIWDLSAQPMPAFKPLPANILVDLVHDGSSDIVIDTQKTDADGTAAFALPVLSPENPNMFFVVHTQGLPIGHGGHAAIPATWSTKGWRSRDGKTAGYNPGFKQKAFGAAASPIEFEVGLLLILKPEYELVSEDHTYVTLLPTTAIKISDGTHEITSTIDERGIFSVFTFEISAGSNLTLELTSAINSGKSAPNLQGVYVTDWVGPQDLTGVPMPGLPLTFILNVAQTFLAKIDRTSYGKDHPPLPWPIKISKSQDYKLCGAFTCLKNLAEVNALIHNTAPGDWDNYRGCHINMGIPGSSGVSFPPEVISLSSAYVKSRSDQIHEASHQFLWAFANLTTVEIISLVTGKVLKTDHAHRRLLNSVTSMIEGWAAVFQMLADYNEVKVTKDNKFAYLQHRTSNFSWQLPISDKDGLDITIGRLNFPNWGECVEGAFGAALFTLFREYILVKQWTPPATGPLIPPHPHADIASHQHLGWLTSTSSDAQTARDRFYNVFVAPAKGLSSSPPTTTNFIDNLKASVGDDWDLVRTIIQDFHLGIPEIVAVQIADDSSKNGKLNEFGRQVQPSLIPAGGGPVEILGLHLGAPPDTEITIGTDQVGFTWKGPSHLSCLAPPNLPGTVATVALFSPDGDHLLPQALLYV